MFLVFKSEIFHRREHLAERMENLCHGRYLPVDVRAADTYGKGKRRSGLSRGIDMHPMENPNMALSNLKFSVVFINFRRCGTEIWVN
jgi:hypothetical protein